MASQRTSRSVVLFAVASILGLLACAPSSPLAAAPEEKARPLSTDTPDPPLRPVKLIFVHHSVGENWLADWDGGLGIALRDNNYFVSDTNYGWGPDGVGDTTDIGHWWAWFRGRSGDTYLGALYAESSQHSSYSRLATDPGGENQIVIFKSCFPNSYLAGSPDDPARAGDNPLRGQDSGSPYHTVGNAKGIYNDILVYFATRPDKLFVIVTAPPQMEWSTDRAHAANARAFSDWLVNDWLDDYPHNNVAVFDLYNVLTSNGGDPDTSDVGWEAGNHHRWWNGAVQHAQTIDNNYGAYGDDHPNSAGNQKATAEFVSLLNVYYNRWSGDGLTPTPALSTATPSAPTPTATLRRLSSGSNHCEPLPPPSGHTITVSTEAEVRDQALNAAPATTILIAPGIYHMQDFVYVVNSGIVLRGQTGDRDDVILDFGGMNDGHFGVLVEADDVTIADLTIRNAHDHGVAIQGSDRPVLYNLHIQDIRDQLVKVNPAGNGSEDGLLACSRLEYTSSAPDNYTNGISAHNAHRWVVRDNEWYRIRTSSNDPVPTILFWSGSSDTVVERNLLVDCYQGIAFGNSSHGSGDHTGGVVRNNMIYASMPHDVAIEMVHATGWLVANNTALLPHPDGVTWGMEARFPDTLGTFAYNLTNMDIINRDGAGAASIGNVTGAASEWFVGPGAGDLHLHATAAGAIDQAGHLDQVTDDYDGDARPIGPAPDVGADEYGVPMPTPIPTLPPGQQHTVVFQQGVSPDPSYAGVADLILANDADTNANLGGTEHLETFFGAGVEHRRSLVHWDLSALPDGITIEAATAELFRYDGYTENAMTLGLYRLIRTWVEGTGDDFWPGPDYVPDGATWPNADHDVPWTTPGGDYEATPLDQVTLPNGFENGWVRLDATAAVRAWAENGVPNYGLLLHPQDGDHTYHYYASRNHSTTHLRPRLVVTYTTGVHPLGRYIYLPLILKQWSTSSSTPRETARPIPPSDRLIQPADLVYQGAFRLPEVPGDYEFSWHWGGEAMTYYPEGDPNGPADGYPGSLFGTGHNWNQWVSEVSIPVPLISPNKNVRDLNTATTLQHFHDIRGGLFDHLDFEIPRAGLAYLPPQGAQATGKLHFCWGQHLQEGETGVSHGWCELSLSNPQTAGAWRMGGYWNYVTNDYLFDIPQAWADTHAPGMYLATGRFRDGGQGGLGPSLLAYGPWNEGNPPPPGSTLSAVPLLLYGNAYTSDAPSMNNYHHSDEWSGGAWLTAGGRSAVVFVGTKGQGDCWYGTPDGPCLDCEDRGWWSTSFEGQIIFYDPTDLAAVAEGELETWEPQPYATLNIDEYLYHIESNQQKYHLGAASFDRLRGMLYVFELLADDDKPLVHVWKVT